MGLERIAVYVLMALLVGALGHGCTMSVQRDKARTELAQKKVELSGEREQRAKETAARAQAASDAATAYRNLERTRAQAAQEIADAHAKTKAARAAARDREHADHDRMRGDVSDYLSAGRGGSAETCPAELAAARDRAATLGDLYLEADRQAGEFEDAAERHADEVRALKRQLLEDRK